MSSVDGRLLNDRWTEPFDGLSGVPSIFEYVGSATDRPAAGQSLQLHSAEQREHGVMWLRYKFHKKLHK